MYPYDYLDYNDYLMHGIFSGWIKKNHKYIDKFKNKVGNWVYVYKKKTENNFKKIQNKAVDTANKLKNTIEKKYTDITKDNPFISRAYNYDRKVKIVKQSKEWKDIVERKDPEYVYKDKNGNIKYDIDNYILKKKHVLLDALDDVYSGREITINEITPQTILAGADDYVQAGLAYVAIRAKVLSEFMKYRQGSYGDQEETVQKTIETGIKMVNDLVEEYDSSDPDLTRYANTIIRAANKNDISIDKVLDNENIQKYLEENNISETELRRYINSIK